MPIEKVWRFENSKEFNKIYVSNISKSATKSEIRDLFSKFGTIVDLRIPDSNRASQYAYIQYGDDVFNVFVSIYRLVVC